MNVPTFAKVVGRRLVGSALTVAMSLIATSTNEAEIPSNSKPERTLSEMGRNMKINIKISSKTLTATLADNPTARDFVSLLPLKLSMNDLFGREKYGDLPRAISEKSPRTHSYQVGDIAYWSPDHQLAVYYRQDNQTIPSPGLIPVAKLDAGIEMFQVPGFVNVTIERAE